MPPEVNPAEFYLDLINRDLAREGDDVVVRVNDITAKWLASAESAAIQREIDNIVVRSKHVPQLSNIKVLNPLN